MEVLLGSAAVAFAVVGLVYSVSSRRAPRNLLNRTDGSAVVADVRELHLSQGAVERVVGPALQGIAGRLRRISPVGRIEVLNQQLELAGLTLRFPVELVLLLKAALGVGAALPHHPFALNQPLGDRRRLADGDCVLSSGLRHR